MHGWAREKHIEKPLNVLQQRQNERLGAVKTEKRHFIIFPIIVREPHSLTGPSSITKGPSNFSPSIEHSATLITSHQLQSDLTALVE